MVRKACCEALASSLRLLASASSLACCANLSLLPCASAELLRAAASCDSSDFSACEKSTRRGSRGGEVR